MIDGEDRPKPAAGWYPHPTMASTQRYWDGHAWTEHVAPIGGNQAASQAPGRLQQSQLVIVGLLAASIVGAVMALQSASLLTGTGTQWTGAAIALAAGVASYVLRKSIPGWLRVVSVIAALLALANVVYLEQQLEERRQDIGQMFD